MNRLISIIACAAGLAINAMPASLTSTALATINNPSPTNCVLQSARGTSSAEVHMGGCFEIPLHVIDPPVSYGAWVQVTTALGSSSIIYAGGSEIDGQYAEGTSGYSETIRFANAGTKEIFADYAITGLHCDVPGSWVYGANLSLRVNDRMAILDPCQAETKLTIDLGSVDTSRRFGLSSEFRFSRYGGNLVYYAPFAAQLQGFQSGPVGGWAEQPITATLVPEPGTFTLLSCGVLVLLIGIWLRRGRSNLQHV